MLSCNDYYRREEKMLRGDGANFPILALHLIFFSLKGDKQARISSTSSLVVVQLLI